MNRKTFRLIAAALLVLVIAASLTGCFKAAAPDNKKEGDSKTTYPLTIKDDLGNEIKIEKEPSKVVSLSPSNTEILFAIGAGDKVVGVSAYCDYPQEAQAREKVGDANAINLEAIVALAPDVVFNFSGWNNQVVDSLKQLGITVVEVKSESIDQVISSINMVGKILNKTEQAKAVTKEIEDKRQEIANKVKGVKEKVTVFYEVWYEPLMTVGNQTFINELISISGGTNIASDVNGYANYAVEKMIEKNPMVYLTTEFNNTMSDVSKRTGHEAIRAVKNKRVHFLDDNLISRPGPRIHLGLEMVAKALYPELFK